MARDRRSAGRASASEREVLITFDLRLLYGMVLLAGFVVAMAAGAWYASRGPEPTGVGGQPASGVGQASGSLPVATIDEAAARATAVALGLPTSAVIVESVDVVTATALPPLLQAAGAVSGTNPSGQLYEFTVPEDRKVDASKWSHTTLANFPDPNVLAEETTPLRLEEVKTVLEGPRIAISDLNHLYTYDYGEVPMDRPSSHDFRVANVGNADLIISRIYSGCGCTATRIGGQTIDPAGYLPQPLVLKPGQSEVFTITFDPQFDRVAMSQAKYVQIFSNDPTRALFDPNEPYSHEVRFRIVVQTVERRGE